jgi:hypothetical protein
MLRFVAICNCNNYRFYVMIRSASPPFLLCVVLSFKSPLCSLTLSCVIDFYHFDVQRNHLFLCIDTHVVITEAATSANHYSGSSKETEKKSIGKRTTTATTLQFIQDSIAERIHDASERFFENCSGSSRCVF